MEFNHLPMINNQFIISSTLLLGFTLPGQAAKKREAAADNKQPNVIFIYADDLGYGDLEWCP